MSVTRQTTAEAAKARIEPAVTRRTPKHPPGMPYCRHCGHAACLHGVDGCVVRSCNCWRTDDVADMLDGDQPAQNEGHPDDQIRAV